MLEKYIWITDPHINNMFPWQKYSFINKIQNEEKPKGVLISGDVSGGPLLSYDLKLLAKTNIPIYFVLGNHAFWWSSFDKTHKRVRKLTSKYPNLIWLEDKEIVPLDDEICLIGAEDWYSADVGDSKWLKYTFDWFMIKDFRQMNSMEERINAFREIADRGVKNIEHKLKKALELDYKTIYILLHYPPFIEATRDEFSTFGKFWLPYNSNIRMGKAIVNIMKDYKNKHVHILAGHSHEPIFIRASRSVDCQIGEGRYLGIPHSQKIYL